ncbi:MAG: hypothetical protein FVQ79_03735 [Planctomycetes bacterium]|nr:hypothetical protein [Planctomycetota bacterium]
MSARIFTLLSGPSCVGKGPLLAALNTFHPDLKYSEIPVIKSKDSRPDGPRPGEERMWEDEDFFRTTEDLCKLENNPQFLVGECRRLRQAVDLEKVNKSQSELLLIEIYHTLGAKLLESTFLREVQVKRLFLSPISRVEIEDLKAANVDVADHVRKLMISKQLARAKYQGKKAAVSEDIEERAADTYKELQYACSCDRVIVNHDGEGSPNWNRLPNGQFTDQPGGDAYRALAALLYILRGSEPPGQCEDWKGLVL